MNRIIRTLAAAFAMTATVVAVDAAELGTAFTYQGRLDDAGTPADGDYDFIFRLFDDPTAGAEVGADVSVSGHAVNDGLFTTLLDFGDVFTGEARWLEIEVRASGTTDYTSLSPRQELTPTPNALNAQLLDGKTVEDIETSGVPNPLVLTGSSTYTIDGFTSSSTSDAAGIRGTALNPASRNYGVLGATASQNAEAAGVYGLAGFGKGVYGLAYEFSGEGVGVYGETNSPAGYAGYFKGGKTYVDGSLGVGTEYPPTPLAIQAPTGLAPCGITQNNLGGEYTMEFTTADELGFQRTRMMLRGNFSDAIEFYRGDAGAETMSMIIDSAGEVGIGTTSPASRLHVVGTTRTSVLQIDGGSDLSEGFAVAGDADPGTVVVIDPARPGALTASSVAYDSRVAGIVSGAGGVATGMLMGQTGSIADGDHPIALTGRVYCKVDASTGPVRPGDLLTTSASPGHAMKVTEPGRAQGAILGKAMTALEHGQGLVLVLVALQ